MSTEWVLAFAVAAIIVVLVRTYCRTTPPKGKHQQMAKNISGDDLPTAYVDGWMANKNNILRIRNPYDIRAQYASHELWVEGWTARQYIVRNSGNLYLDDFVPRVTF